MELVEVNARHQPGGLDSAIQVVDEHEQHVEVLTGAEGLRPHLCLKSPTLGQRPVRHPCFYLHGKRGRGVAEVEHQVDAFVVDVLLVISDGMVVDQWQVAARGKNA